MSNNSNYSNKSKYSNNYYYINKSNNSNFLMGRILLHNNS